jgi:hypothetical protein
MPFDQSSSTFSPFRLSAAACEPRDLLAVNLLKIGSKLCVAGLILLVLTLSASFAFAADVTLAWDPNDEDDVEGYGVYFSQDDPGPPYSLFGYVALNEFSDSSSPAFTLTGLENGSRYYFAVTAYDTAGNESDFSTSVCADVDDVVTPCVSSNIGGGTEIGSGGGGGSSSGGGGGGCFIESAAAGDPGFSQGMNILIALGCMAVLLGSIGRKAVTSLALLFIFHPPWKAGRRSR